MSNSHTVIIHAEMTPFPPERGAEANRIFHNALAYPADRRPTYISEACGEDVVLSDEVRARLKYHERADSMATLEPPPDALGPIEVTIQIDDDAATASIEGVPHVHAPQSNGHAALWWWQLHQLVVCVAYGVALYFLWITWQWTGVQTDQWMFLGGLAAALSANTIRLHLWFTSRLSPQQWRSVRRSAWPWLRIADGLVGMLLLMAGAGQRAEQPMLAATLLGSALIVLVAFLLIEPAMTRAIDRGTEAH